MSYTTPIPENDNPFPFRREYDILSFSNRDKDGHYKATVKISYNRSISHPQKTTYYHSIYVSLTFDAKYNDGGSSFGCGNPEMYQDMFADSPHLEKILRLEKWHLWDLNTGARHYLENGWYHYNRAFNESYQWFKEEEREKALEDFKNHFQFGLLPDDDTISFRKFGIHPEWGFIDKKEFTKNATARLEPLMSLLMQDLVNLNGYDYLISKLDSYVIPHIPFLLAKRVPNVELS